MGNHFQLFGVDYWHKIGRPSLATDCTKETETDGDERRNRLFRRAILVSGDSGAVYTNPAIRGNRTFPERRVKMEENRGNLSHTFYLVVSLVFSFPIEKKKIS